VYKIYNYRLWERYCEREREVNEDFERNSLHEQKNEYRRLFHGTTAADAIVRNGFDKSRSDSKGMLGKGSEIIFSSYVLGNERELRDFGIGERVRSIALILRSYKKLIYLKTYNFVIFIIQNP
jgi:hypothetical protein